MSMAISPGIWVEEIDPHSLARWARIDELGELLRCIFDVDERWRYARALCRVYAQNDFAGWATDSWDTRRLIRARAWDYRSHLVRLGVMEPRVLHIKIVGKAT